jgi:hypothetical protein
MEQSLNQPVINQSINQLSSQLCTPAAPTPSGHNHSISQQSINQKKSINQSVVITITHTRCSHTHSTVFLSQRMYTALLNPGLFLNSIG